jgi:ATP-independent RNA helicase DbpA
LVIHYQFPHSKEDFIHRNGRTARMKAEGTVLLIHSESEPLPDYCNDFEINKIKGYEDFKDFKPSDKFPVYLSAGRKDKIRKIDIVGFFTKEAGIKNENLGLIEVYDQHSLITLSVSDLKIIKNLIPQVKIKKQKIKISFFK